MILWSTKAQVSAHMLSGTTTGQVLATPGPSDHPLDTPRRWPVPTIVASAPGRNPSTPALHRTVEARP